MPALGLGHKSGNCFTPLAIGNGHVTADMSRNGLEERKKGSSGSYDMDAKLIPDTRLESFADGEEDQLEYGNAIPVDKTLQLIYQDNSYKDSLLARLDTLRKHREFCDVVLFVSGREINAHRVVLAALSPTLCEIFTERGKDRTIPVSPSVRSRTQEPDVKEMAPHEFGGEAKEVENGEENTTILGSPTQDGDTAETEKVGDRARKGTENGSSNGSTNGNEVVSTERPLYLELDHVDFISFQALVNYAYTSRLEIPAQKVADLYKAACFFRVKSCSKACAQYLVENLSVENCIGIRKCANKTNDPLLASKVDDYIKENIADITERSPQLSSLPCIQLEVIRTYSVDVTGGTVEDHRGIAERILAYFQRLPPPQGNKEFRIDELAEKSYLLFLEEDGSLKDCCDVDDSSSVGSCDLVQDYKRSSARNKSSSSATTGQSGRRSPDTATQNGAMNGVVGPKGTMSGGWGGGPRVSRFNSVESINSIASSAENDEITWDVVAVTKSSDSFSVALVVMYQRLICLFVQVLDQHQRVGNQLLSPKLTSVEVLPVTMEESGVGGGGGGAETVVVLPQMSNPRCSCGAVNLNGRIVVVGGYDRGECMRSVEELDLEKNEWRNLAFMKEERGRFDATVCDGKIYALGGCNGNSDLRSVECYDSESQKWTSVAPMLLVKSNNGCCSMEGKVYSVGGWNGKVGTRECERFDPSVGVWEPIAPMITKRYQAGITAWKNKIVAVGGCDAWNCLNSVEMYDGVSETWKSLPNMNTPRRGCGVAVLNGKLYVVGGSDGSYSLSSVEVLDLSDLTWSQGPALRTPRANVHCVALDKKIFAVGGFNGKNFLSTVEYLDIDSQEWRTKTVTNVAPEAVADKETEADPPVPPKTPSEETAIS